MRGRENVTLLLLGVGKGNEIMLSFVSCFLKISFSTLLSASWFRVEAPKKKKKKKPGSLSHPVYILNWLLLF